MDKLAKVRAQIAALQDATMDENKNFLTAYDEGKFDALSAVDALLDSLQEEPVAPKVLEDMLNAKTAAESLGISQEEHDRIVDELIYGKEPELVDVDDLPNKEEEPVSEELEEAAWLYYDKNRLPIPPELDLHKEFIDFFKAGAQWQKEQLMKDAVYGLVCGHDESSPAWIDLNLLNKPNIKVGTEVKLIIIKDE